MKFIVKLVVSTLAVLITAMLLPGVEIADNSFLTALGVAVVLAFLNAIVKPILVILTIPVTIFSFGLFILVINAVLILWASKIVNGFHVDNFWRALLFSLILSVVTWILEAFQGNDDKRRNRE
jgi:putative membrane protein